jgi:hypothetical protein
MTFFNPWLDMMRDVIQWQQLSGYDGHGQPSFGTITEIKCRIVDKERLIRTLDGQEVVSKTTIYCDSDHGVDVNDRITLPSGEQPIMLRINTYPDEQGNRFEEILT